VDLIPFPQFHASVPQFRIGVPGFRPTNRDAPLAVSQLDMGTESFVLAFLAGRAFINMTRHFGDQLFSFLMIPFCMLRLLFLF
jgi:hypothetical protein